MGASRWLDANRLAGTSTNSAMAKATTAFRCFIVESSEIEVGGRRPSSNLKPGARRHAPSGYDLIGLRTQERINSGSGFVTGLNFHESLLSRSFSLRSECSGPVGGCRDLRYFTLKALLK